MLLFELIVWDKFALPFYLLILIIQTKELYFLFY